MRRPSPYSSITGVSIVCAVAAESTRWPDCSSTMTRARSVGVVHSPPAAISG